MSKKLLIIGGGTAGLVAGILAQKKGYSCTILEKNSFPGGNLTAWNRSGYHIDNSLHWLNGTRDGSSLNQLWREVCLLGDDIPVLRPEKLFSSEYRGETLTFYRDASMTEEEMLLLSPDDYAEILSFFKALRALRKISDENMPLSQKLTVLPSLAPFAGLSAEEYASRFRHPLLKRAFCDFIGGSYSCLALLYAYASFSDGDADLPAGGSSAAAMRMADRFSELGGRLLLGKPAAKIIVKENHAVGVETESGEGFPADAVIATTEPAITFGKLLPENLMPKALRTRYRNGKSFSAIHAAFSADADAGIPEGTTVFETEPFTVGGRQSYRMVVRNYAYEPSFAPEGKVVLQTLFWMEEGGAERWIKASEQPEFYCRAKEKFGEEMKKRLEKEFPSANPEVLDVWTPATYQHYFGAPKGAFLSFLMTPSALFYHQSPRVPKVRNLFLATQWQKIPGGLPIAAKQAQKAVELLSRVCK